MGWVYPPKFFYAFSETLTEVANAIFDMSLPFSWYVPITKIPNTVTGPLHTSYSHNHIYLYMYDFITAVQGGTGHQCQVFGETVKLLKWILLSFDNEYKDSFRVKKLMAGDGEWTCFMEVLGWTLTTGEDTVALPYRNQEEILSLLDLPSTQRAIGWNDMEHLIRMIWYTDLVVLGEVSYLSHIKRTMTQGGENRAYRTPDFHQELVDW